MRQVTATEKYNAVLEGKMAKREFVRQMRQSYPMYISQYDGFDSTVQILKNRQMIFEAQKPAFSGVKVYDDRPALTYSLDALDRGIRAELAVLNLDPASNRISKEDLDKATDKAKSNLEKDANHYLNLMSGESNKVDKHDKEKEVKRGAPDKDTFNDMKKATLKEEVETVEEVVEELSIRERLTEKLSNPTLLAAVKEIKAMHPEVTSGIVDHFVEMYGQSISDGADPIQSFTEYVNEISADSIVDETEFNFFKEFFGIGSDNVVANTNASDQEIEAYLKSDDYQEELKNSDLDEKDIMNWKESFLAWREKNLEEKKGKDHDGDGDIDSDDYLAAKDKAIKKAMGKDVDEALDSLMAEDSKTMGKRELAPYYAAAAKAAGFSDEQIKKAFGLVYRFSDKRAKGRRVKFINYGWAGYEDLYKNLVDILNKADGGGWEVKNEGSWYGDGNGWQVVKTYTMEESYAMKRMQQAHTQDRLAGKKSTYDQAKEKQKDQEKQLKEAIKSIIKKTLLNEAATVRLADWADEYETFPGVKPVVNELENIVTEIETFYDKMSDKIKNVFEKTAGFENEEGLKIGGFIAPSLESAFRQDLSKVIKKGSFFSKINLPKVRTVTQADIDGLRSSERPLGETDVTEEPKSTVFTPNF